MLKATRFFLIVLLMQGILIAVTRLFFPTTFMAEQILFISLLQLLFLFLLERNRKIGVRNRGVIALSVLISFNLFAFTIGNVQRSTSLYIVQWVSVFPEGVSEDKLVSTLEAKFGEIDRIGIRLRLEEHEKRRIFKISNGQYRLDLAGRVVLSSADLLSDVFNLHEWRRRSL